MPLYTRSEPQAIAKIQHRKNLNLVVDYFSQKTADALLREDTRVERKSSTLP